MLSLAGTVAAPLVVVDTAAPLTVGSGCSPVAGDPTRAICNAPKAAGTDTFSGDFASDTLRGGDGSDFIHGNAADNTVSGRDGNDIILGGPGKDNVLGNGDNDTLSGNTLSIFQDAVNSDGAIDIIVGGVPSDNGDDTCIQSTADPDKVVECDTVIVDN